MVKHKVHMVAKSEDDNESSAGVLLISVAFRSLADVVPSFFSITYPEGYRDSTSCPILLCNLTSSSTCPGICSSSLVV